MRVLVLIALLVGVALAAPNTSSLERISGGSETKIQEYKFMGALKIGAIAVYTYHCGAALISNTVALTTADCVKLTVTSTLQLSVGSASSGGLISGSGLRIQDVKSHPNFDRPKQAYDVAILFLRDRATQSATVGYARVPGVTYNIADDTEAVALGWGTTKEPGWFPESNSETLKSVTLKIVNQEKCKTDYKYLQGQPLNGYLPDVHDTMICAAVVNEKKGACKGDEGGALVVSNDILAGLFSWVYRCGDTRYASVFTRISTVAKWIIDETA
ncbi:trypsin-1 [Plutella xylostella]|uniref:trypsin-1 n=1 Tax=Plutella xylostella TaxID=51655 RepID=UPI002032FF8C|nr:trypsin-1 [Plutella xylostella]